MSQYRFIHAHQASYPITVLCRVLDVARSGYDAWRRRGVSARQQADRQLSEQIGTVHQQSRQTYGSPRIHAALRQAGVCCGRKRVARLMRQAGLTGCRARRRTRTTRSDPAHVPAPNLVERDFTVVQLDHLWVGDITYIPTWEGWLYLAVILDAGVPPGSAARRRLGDGGPPRRFPDTGGAADGVGSASAWERAGASH